MRKVSITITLLLSITLSSRAPNLDLEYQENRAEGIVKATLEKDALDKRVADILKTIRIVETRENYTLKGGSGEYGAYQFTKSTWRYYSQVFFKEVLDITDPDNQDKVAEAKVRMLIKSGFTDEEIASFWNSGKRYYKGNIGINSYGIRYNVPAYVKQFVNVKNNLA